MFILLLILLGASGMSSPEAVVRNFCSAYVDLQDASPLDDRRTRTVLSPFLTTALTRHLSNARACRKDWVRQQPHDTTDKPPLVDCCFFSSTPDGVPTGFSVGPAQAVGNGRWTVVVDFELRIGADTIKWQDAMLVRKEKGRYLIDDVVYNVGDGARGDAAHLRGEFDGCRGPRWIGG